MNITELMIEGFFTALIAVLGAIAGGYLGVRLTLSLYEKQETRRRKIDVLQRFRGGLANGTSHGPMNEASVAFSDSDEVMKTLKHLHQLVKTRDPGASNQNADPIEQEIENIIRAMHKDVGLDEPKEHWQLRGFLEMKQPTGCR